MEESKVYVLPDEQNRIIRCEGGYTLSNIQDIKNWILIDSGSGDKYNLAQSHYFGDGLYTDDGIARYKLVDGAAVLRSAAEVEADRSVIPAPPQTAEERIAELEEAIRLLLEGATE